MESKDKDQVHTEWAKDVDLIGLETLIDSLKWKRTNYVAYHEYIMEFWPKGDVLYNGIKQMLDLHGYEKKFKGFPYRYWNNRGMRYWIFDNLDGTRSRKSAINRTHEDQERT